MIASYLLDKETRESVADAADFKPEEKHTLTRSHNQQTGDTSQ